MPQIFKSYHIYHLKKEHEKTSRYIKTIIPTCDITVPDTMFNQYEEVADASAEEEVGMES
jgi:hypothetical protein